MQHGCEVPSFNRKKGDPTIVDISFISVICMAGLGISTTVINSGTFLYIWSRAVLLQESKE